MSPTEFNKTRRSKRATQPSICLVTKSMHEMGRNGDSVVLHTEKTTWAQDGGNEPDKPPASDRPRDWPKKHDQGRNETAMELKALADTVNAMEERKHQTTNESAGLRRFPWLHLLGERHLQLTVSVLGFGHNNRFTRIGLVLGPPWRPAKILPGSFKQHRDMIILTRGGSSRSTVEELVRIIAAAANGKAYREDKVFRVSTSFRTTW